MNRKRIVITIIGAILSIIIVVLAGGFRLVSYVLDKDKCSNVESYALFLDEYTVELSNENSKLYHDISLKDEEDIEKLIVSTGISTSEDLRYAFLNSGSEDLSFSLNELKLAFVLRSFYKDDVDVQYFKVDFLNKEIEKVFNSGIVIYRDFNESFLYDGIFFSTVCDKDVCSVNYEPRDDSNYSYYGTKIVDSKKSGENTIYTVKEYYVIHLHDEDGNIISSEMYDTWGGKLLDKNNCSNNCDELIKNVNLDKLNTYEITFDKDNRYLSGKKVN